MKVLTNTLQCQAGITGSHRWTRWIDLIPAPQWASYRRALERAVSLKIPFALGGGFATATHTGCSRDTEDMDLYVLPRDRDLMVRALEDLGMKDIHDRYPYDRGWTYRASDGTVIVEVIWRMRNHLACIDEPWLGRAMPIEIRGLAIPVAPPEEMIWAKLYVMMHDRCDWPDVLNYFYFCGGGLDWAHLVDRLGEDTPLLAAALAVFSWLSPGHAASVPAWVWERVGLRRAVAPVTAGDSDDERRAALFCTNAWFGPMAHSSHLEKSG